MNTSKTVLLGLLLTSQAFIGIDAAATRKQGVTYIRAYKGEDGQWHTPGGYTFGMMLPDPKTVSQHAKARATKLRTLADKVIANPALLPSVLLELQKESDTSSMKSPAAKEAVADFTKKLLEALDLPGDLFINIPTEAEAAAVVAQVQALEMTPAPVGEVTVDVTPAAPKTQNRWLSKKMIVGGIAGTILIGAVIYFVFWHHDVMTVLKQAPQAAVDGFNKTVIAMRNITASVAPTVAATPLPVPTVEPVVHTVAEAVPTVNLTAVTQAAYEGAAKALREFPAAVATAIPTPAPAATGIKCVREIPWYHVGHRIVSYFACKQ